MTKKKTIQNLVGKDGNTALERLHDMAFLSWPTKVKELSVVKKLFDLDYEGTEFTAAQLATVRKLAAKYKCLNKYPE